MSTLRHKTLGEIKGKVNNGVAQYFGLKYASLKHRFGPPELFDDGGQQGVIDATTLGPAVIGIPNGAEAEFGLIQQSLPVPDFPPQSDIDGLNLTVTVPEGYTNRKLPVFVFIHGGALSMGSSCWPQYDHAAFVRRSVELGRPVIGVNFNYRTGIFGFLTSEELRRAGFKANNGLRDQKVAFQWVKKHISGFNGDPENITAVGQSAGGVSATLQFQSPEPLFKRLVDLAGTFLLLRPLPTSVHELFYQQFVEIHGLADVTGEERIHAIEKIDSHELLLKVPPSLPSLPTLDFDFINAAPTFESVEQWHTKGDSFLHGLKWTEELLVGDNQLDGNIYQLALAHRKAGIGKQLEESLKRSIPGHEKAIDALLEEYGISSANNDEDQYLKVLEFANDIAFYLPEETLAKNFPGTTYVYHLNVPNPWDGPFKGHATHIFDVALLFRNFEHHLDATTKAAGEAFGDSIIKFINGESPWKATTREDPVAMVYNYGDQGKLMADEPDKVGRRSSIFKFKESIGYDVLHEAFIAFLGDK